MPFSMASALPKLNILWPLARSARDSVAIATENTRLREQVTALQADRQLIWDQLRRKPEQMDDNELRLGLRAAIDELDRHAERLRVFLHIILVSGSGILGAMIVLTALVVKGILLR